MSGTDTSYRCNAAPGSAPTAVALAVDVRTAAPPPVPPGSPMQDLSLRGWWALAWRYPGLSAGLGRASVVYTAGVRTVPAGPSTSPDAEVRFVGAVVDGGGGRVGAAFGDATGLGEVAVRAPRTGSCR